VTVERVESETGVSGATLRARWLGKVRYSDSVELQRALHSSCESYLLLLEHPNVYTLGVRTSLDHILVDPHEVGAEMVWTDRGGDVTFHGPGQLVGYPILDVPIESGAVPAFVHRLESVLIEVLGEFGIEAYADPEYPGVWVDRERPRKIAALGVKIAKGRSMHGFALNVSTDLGMFSHIVPCGITDREVTSMAAEGSEVEVADVASRIALSLARAWNLSLQYRGLNRLGSEEESYCGSTSPARERSGPSVDGVASSLNRRLLRAGVDTRSGLRVRDRKPEWMRRKAVMGEEYRSLKGVMRKFSLTTVCEEAGCPNIFECWADGTATFMINGERCTRACGFCLVDTSLPLPLDPDEPRRVAEAVSEMGLRFAVITAVARDDLSDGGASGFVRTLDAIRSVDPSVGIEVLIPDCKGSSDALGSIFSSRPDVLNHNIETPLRLQKAVRPSASYARSLSVLARAKMAGLTTKSGVIVGMGESIDEVFDTLADLRAVGVDILTVGQYLRPTARHAPVMRYYEPEEFEKIREFAESIGFAHVEAGPMARSSYHARQGSESLHGDLVALG
jgi:lipoic acid synthetase